MASGTGDPTRSGTTTIVAARSYHVTTIDGYSSSLNTHGYRPSYNSDPFRAGGRTWHVIYKPMGSPCRPDNTEYISVSLALDDVVAVDEAVMAMGTEWFIKRKDLERSECLKDYCFAIRVHVHLIKEAPPMAVVPPPDIHRRLGDLLSSKEGTVVEFRVRGGKTFAADRLVLGARWPVFRAELFGPMKEGTTTDVIQIGDMEGQVFGGLPTFVYTDAWPEIKQEEGDECAMAQHLLAAADRYALQRLKVMCEEKLCEHIDASSVASILALAEQHQCPRLKKACFKFLGFSSVAFLEAIESEEF
ncbi:BTB/POZ and MATH domain-containing protein 1-like [Setaria italica]|uniref:BTB domain-containing protein n=1 Tax=Setaria italica TaxID=4555 RepID=K3YD00_SETIT|nr:BTB/POZ and MATH domain-containing protein 1-like [Setaria italica]